MQKQKEVLTTFEMSKRLLPILFTIVMSGLIAVTTATKVRERFPYIPDHEFTFGLACVSTKMMQKVIKVFFSILHFMMYVYKGWKKTGYYL